MDAGLSIQISFQRFETEENWGVLRLYEGLGEDKNLTGETPKGGAGVRALNDWSSFHFGEQLRSQAPPLLRPSGCCQIERLLCLVPMTTTTCQGSTPPTEPPTPPACQVLCSLALDLKPFPVRGSVCVLFVCVFRWTEADLYLWAGHVFLEAAAGWWRWLDTNTRSHVSSIQRA